MEDRLQQFRAAYQAKISPLYNGWLHGAWIFGFGAVFIAWCASRVENGGWAWLSVIPALLVANLGEWWLHKNALHRRIDALKALWHRHTIEHHHYFTETRMSVDSQREYRIILFPAYAIVGIALIHALFGGLWAVAFGANAGWAWMIGGMSHYLLYEVLHTAARSPEHSLLAKRPRKAVCGADGFFAVDLRVGTVIAAEPFAKARKPAYRLKVDFGPVVGVL
ncbi:hypothetical protein [Sinimarinibacterium thermocellulolyticum]|uniref:hypothetical protein n=1 Tax=Sinimarinibacterium thermocellulolyticum TaxID=3170016 RepID=UPI003DA194AD